MSHKKKEDNFDSIVNSIKSLKTIKFKFSNQFAKFDKFFKNLSIEALEKKLHQKGKPPPTFHDTLLYKNIDKTYNLHSVNYEYFEDINGIKNMPIKIEKKEKDFTTRLYNPEFEKKIDEIFFPKKEEEKEMYKKEKKFYKRINKTYFGLDPGYYHPNYKIIEKRSPCFDFGKAIRNSDLNKEKINKLNIKEEINKDISEEKEKMSEGFSNINLKENNNFNNYKTKKVNMNNQIIKLNLIKVNKTDKTLIISRNPKFNNIKNNTQNSILPKINLNKDTIPENKSIFKKMNIKRNIKKVYSTPNLISFEKMRGRDDLKDGMINKSRDIFYQPNYDSTKPHIPSFFFKASCNTKDYKKYRVGKIIRSYIFEPDKYFILDINKNKIENKNPKNIIDLKLYQLYQNKSHNE